MFNDNSFSATSPNEKTSISYGDVLAAMDKAIGITKDNICCILITTQPFVPAEDVYIKSFEGKKYMIMSMVVYYELRKSIPSAHPNNAIESFSGIPVIRDDALLLSVWNEIHIPNYLTDYRICGNIIT